MATKAKALEAIAAFNGEVDWDVTEIGPREKHIVIDAPEGFIWDYTECSVICISWYCGSASEFWDEVIYEVLCGVQRHYDAA